MPGKTKMTVSLLAGLLFMTGCQRLSSHHASIHVHLSEDDSSGERLMQYERVIESMEAWAQASDMYLVTNPGDMGNLSSFTTNPDADVRECCFKDKLSSKGPMPLQVMSSYDVNGLQIVRILFAEGYSEEPSERLKKISSDLHRRLLTINEQTYYSIW